MFDISYSVISSKEKPNYTFDSLLRNLLCFLGGASGKEPACQCWRQEAQVRSLGWEDTLEDGMATHSSVVAWIIPWTEESGRL